jgi:hypothetical protein
MQQRQCGEHRGRDGERHPEREVPKRLGLDDGQGQQAHQNCVGGHAITPAYPDM